MPTTLFSRLYSYSMSILAVDETEVKFMTDGVLMKEVDKVQ